MRRLVVDAGDKVNEGHKGEQHRNRRQRRPHKLRDDPSEREDQDSPDAAKSDNRSQGIGERNATGYSRDSERQTRGHERQ